MLPDGSYVTKGSRVTYHPYAMGRMERVWGSDCGAGLQDIMRRFSFDNICKFSFGWDPQCLQLSLLVSDLAMAFARRENFGSTCIVAITVDLENQTVLQYWIKEEA